MNRESAETYFLAGVGGLEGVFQYYIRPELTAKRGWLAVAAVVGAYEVACPRGELLSEGVDRAMESHPVLTPLIIGTVALHLLNVLPPRYDPLHIMSESLKAYHQE